jgi:arylsulfatase A-like enzyme
MLGIGPDFAAGRVVDKRARLIDVAPTLAHLLGLDFRSRGRVIPEALA